MVVRVALLMLSLLAVGCAPWAPAPVEQRDRPVRAEPEKRVISPAPSVYEVQRGDTLYSIAFRYGLDWREVAGWNGIGAPFTIRPGQELRLTRPPRSAQRPAASDQSREETGDSAGEVEQAPAEQTRAPEPAPEPEETEPEPQPSPDASDRVRRAAGVEWQWPTEGSIENAFDPSATRRGIGVAGSAGQPVRAAAGGEVVYSGKALIGYGELIIIKHNDSLLSAYGFNRARHVAEGDRVSRGERIADMGLNERDEEMLHFEIRRNGQPVNPLDFLPAR